MLKAVGMTAFWAPQNVFDVSGAGDTVTAVVAAMAAVEVQSKQRLANLLLL